MKIKRKRSSAGGIIAQECSSGIECRCSHLTAVAAWLPLKLQHTRALVMKMLDALMPGWVLASSGSESSDLR